MKNSRLFKVFTSLCMIVGMLFNVKTVDAEGDDPVLLTVPAGIIADVDIISNNNGNPQIGEISIHSSKISYTRKS